MHVTCDRSPCLQDTSATQTQHFVTVRNRMGIEQPWHSHTEVHKVVCLVVLPRNTRWFVAHGVLASNTLAIHNLLKQGLLDCAPSPWYHYDTRLSSFVSLGSGKDTNGLSKQTGYLVHSSVWLSVHFGWNSHMITIDHLTCATSVAVAAVSLCACSFAVRFWAWLSAHQSAVSRDCGDRGVYQN